MRRNFTCKIIAISIFLFSNKLHSQQLEESEFFLNAENYTDLSFLPSAPGWGYSFSNLTEYLYGISSSPLVKIDTIGFSVQNRPILQITINNNKIFGKKDRIMIHARTHPAEVQSSYVTKEIMNILLSNSALAATMLKYCTFNIVPMINPDGVELGNLRENANNVDLEGNWATTTPEPEVKSLNLLFEKYMYNNNPIKIALNMHSSISCARYFVFHSPNGTSSTYAQNEKRFINDVRRYWPDSISNWDYMVTWASSTPAIYPESWFWLNHGDKVLALTYEDMNCPQNGNYNKTADALLRGIRDYLNLDGTLINSFSAEENNISVYPNPISSGEMLYVSGNEDFDNTSIYIISMDSRIVYCNKIKDLSKNINIVFPHVTKGMYLMEIRTPSFTQSSKIIVE